MGKVIVIAGPTCSGKSALAIRLAEELESEIISADSRQVYRYLDIGTAKPQERELKRIRHHLINLVTPDITFNAGMFATEAEKIISEICDLQKIPVVAGGTGLYIKSLIDGIIEDVDSDEDLRRELLDERIRFGNEYLYEKLMRVDKVSASKMLPQNWKRVIRALEVFYTTGKPIWKHFEAQRKPVQWEYFQFAPDWDRKLLYKMIDERADKMIEQGLVEEVKSILGRGYSSDSNALNTVGYKEIISYLENEISIERAIELIKRNTRRYAKRQLTWFNADKRIEWIKMEKDSDFERAINLILKKVLNERKN